jgi:hypothetical protein
MISLNTAALRAEAEAEPAAGGGPEPEISRKLSDLQSQIDQLKADLAQARKARVEAAATPSQPAAAPAESSEPNMEAAAARAEATSPAPESSEPEKQATLTSILAPTTVDGFVDVYYGYNFNHPQNQITSYRAFDAPDNQFSLNQVQIKLDKSVDASSRLGYRFSFGYGNAMNVVNGAEAGGLGFAQYVEEAYMTYLAPVGKKRPAGRRGEIRDPARCGSYRVEGQLELFPRASLYLCDPVLPLRGPFQVHVEQQGSPFRIHSERLEQRGG